MGEDEVAKQREMTREKVARRDRKLRGGREGLEIRGRDVILVDDRLASGATMLVAVASARNLGAETVSVAVPTVHIGAIERVSERVNWLYCANVRSKTPFGVASAYGNWRDVPEGEAIAMLS